MTVHTRPRTDDARLEASLSAWQRAGLLDAEHADAIRAFEAGVPPAPEVDGTLAAAPTGTARRVPVAAEALGYLGAILGVVGAVLLVVRRWQSMPTDTRLGVSLAACLVLLVGGASVPHRDEPVLERLRSFLWLGCVAAGALTAGVFMHDEVLDSDQWSLIVFAGAAVATILSLVLWWQRERPLLQLTYVAGALVTVGTMAAQAWDTAAVGVAVWTTGWLFVVAGIAGLTTTTWITVGAGAVGTAVGGAMTASDLRGPGLIMWLLTAVALFSLAAGSAPVRRRSDRVVLFVVGGASLLQAVPPAVAHFADRAGIATGSAVAVAGVVALALAGSPLVRAKVTVQLAAGALMVAGAATMGVQSVAVATTVGLLVAATLIGVGMAPAHVLMSVFGCIGLLINVPWAVSHFFPGEGRAPLLVAVSGLVLVVAAVWLSRRSGEMRHALRRPR